MCIFLKEKQEKSAQWLEKVRYLWFVQQKNVDLR